MTERVGRRKSGGRSVKRESRLSLSEEIVPFIKREIPYFEYFSEESLCEIENAADTVLEEIGIEFRDDPEALDILSQAGAHVSGARVRFDRGMCRSIIRESAPSEFVQHARNSARSTTIGGARTVLAPAYGSPLVRDDTDGFHTQFYLPVLISSRVHSVV